MYTYNSKRKFTVWRCVYFSISFNSLFYLLKLFRSHAVLLCKEVEQVVHTKIFVSLRSLCTNPLSCKYTSPFNILSNIFVKSSHASTNSGTLLSFSLNIWHVFLRLELHWHISMICLSHNMTSAREQSHTSINMLRYSFWLPVFSMETPLHCTIFGCWNALNGNV